MTAAMSALSPTSSGMPLTSSLLKLDAVARVLFQPPQRGITGTKVVEHDPHTEGFEVLQCLDRDRVWCHQRALVDLERELRSRELGMGQGLVDRLCEAGLGQLACRHVHSELERAPEQRGDTAERLRSSRAASTLRAARERLCPSRSE